MINNFNVSEEIKPTERFWITDENHQYVDGNAIRQVGNREYIYLSYPQIQKAYTDESRAYAELFQLRKMNEFAKMEHEFKLHYEELQPKKRYVIKTNDGKFVDANSIHILSGEDGYRGSHWRLLTFTSTINGGFMYNTTALAEKALAKLNELKQLAGFNVEFHIEQYFCDCETPAELSVLKMPIVHGKATLYKKLLKKIRMQYMN